MPLEHKTDVRGNKTPMLTWDYMVRYREAYENEMEYFIDMMTEGKPSPTKRNEILGTMKVRWTN